MRYVKTILLLGIVGTVTAGDFKWAIFGDPPDQTHQDAVNGLFDGQRAFNTPSFIWAGTNTNLGVGLELRFDSVVEVTKVIVSTAKPNRLPFAQTSTEILCLNDNAWKSLGLIPDVTKRAHDPEFFASEMVTEWEGKGVSSDTWRIELKGSGVWLTDIEVYGKVDGQKEIKFSPREQYILTDLSLKPNDFLGGATANIEFSGKDLVYVGNPNTLTRNDRILVNFDVSQYMLAGRVSDAKLLITGVLNGIQGENTLEVEAFTKEVAKLDKLDIISQDVKACGEFVVKSDSTAVAEVIDVSSIVNAALKNGEGTVTFRVRNVTTESLTNNRAGAAECVIIRPEGIQLKVVK